MITQTDIEYWASADYLRQQLLDARADAQANSNKMLVSLLGLLSLYSWDATRNVYLYDGKEVDPLQTKTALQVYIKNKRVESGADALAYLRGKITIDQFTAKMRDGILNAHLNAAALSAGGWGNVSDAQYRLIRDELLLGDPAKERKGDLDYLLLLLLGLSAGTIIKDGRIVTRATQYVGSANVVYENLRREAAMALGVSTPESNAAAAAAQDAQWSAQTKEAIQRKAEAAQRRAEATAAKAEATAADVRQSQAARQAAEDAKINAEAAQKEADAAMNRAEQLAPEGAMYERNIRHARDSCGGCIHETARGWVPIGTLVPTGYRDCRGNCLCSLEYELYSILVAQGAV